MFQIVPIVPIDSENADRQLDYLLIEFGLRSGLALTTHTREENTPQFPR